MDIIKEVNNSTRRIVITPDDCPIDPRDDDNLGITAFFHKRYTIGDTIHLKEDPYEFREWVTTSDEVFMYLPVYMYDHSGVTIRTYPFSCPWDSGLLGYIYATKERVIAEYGSLDDDVREKVKKVLIAEIEALDRYISGECYCASVEENDEIIDSFCGATTIDEVKEFLHDYLDESWDSLIDEL